MKKIVAIVVVIAVALTGFGAWYLLDSGMAVSGTPDQITIGFLPLEQVSLLFIADDQGFFAKNGLNVTIRNYANGAESISAAMDKKADIAISAEYPVVRAISGGNNISIIGTIARFENDYLIGRKDRGIRNISDLKGKKIGYPKGTILEFFLGRFLDLHGMSIRDVTLVDINASHVVDAIGGGEVDVIVYYQPYIYDAKKRLGDNAVTWSAQSGQQVYGVLVSRSDWIAAHPEQIRKLLQSLADAEDYSLSHPAEVKAIIQKQLNFSYDYLAEVWQENQFSLTLDQSLLIAMSDEGRWMINNNLTSEKTLPYFRDHIYTKGMEEIKPEALNIR